MNVEKNMPRTELEQGVRTMLQSVSYRYLSIIHALLKRWSGKETRV